MPRRGPACLFMNPTRKSRGHDQRMYTAPVVDPRGCLQSCDPSFFGRFGGLARPIGDRLGMQLTLRGQPKVDLRDNL